MRVKRGGVSQLPDRAISPTGSLTRRNALPERNGRAFPAFTNARGNPNTKPEESFNLNGSIGGQFNDGMFRWEAIGFYREIKNRIGLVDFDPVTNQDLFGNLPGRVNVSGGEFVVDAVITPDFSANGS